MVHSENMVLCLLAKCCNDSIFAVAAKFLINSNDMLNTCVSAIKDRFWFYFSNLIIMKFYVCQ